MTVNQPNPYLKMAPSDGEAHPLDSIARSRVSSKLMERIKNATAKLEQDLGESRCSWLDVEALLVEYRARREEVLYNIGHEHGFLAGSTHMLSVTRQRPTGADYHVLAEQVRKQLVVSELPQKLRVAVLLDAAWGLLSESIPDK